MAAPHKFAGPFTLGGIDHRGSDVSTPPTVAFQSLNIDYFQGGEEAIIRNGMKAVGDNLGNSGGFGCFPYTKITASGTTQERLICGSKLYRQLTGTFAISYAGAGLSVTVSILPDQTTGHWFCKIQVDGVTVLNQDLGVGFDEASIFTCANLATAINLVASFTATNTGYAGMPAAMLPKTVTTSFTGGPLAYTFSYLYNQQVNQPTGAPDPFAGSLTNRNAADFENITSVEKLNVRFFANYYDSMKVYDGSDIYKNGLPQIPTPGQATVAGGIAAGTYQWMATAVQKDAVGNIYEGPIGGIVGVTTGGPASFNLTIANIQNNTGFNTDSANVNGNQVGVTTIAVTAGHSMKIGQTAFFLDRASGFYVERAINGKSNTTIDIAGAAVNVNNNDPISNNLRLRLYRTKNGGSLFYQVVELPNYSVGASIVYNDTLADTALSALYANDEARGFEHSLPPRCKYIASYKNTIIGMGDPSNPYKVYSSDQDNPWSWPVICQIYCQSNTNSVITGGIEEPTFFRIFKKFEEWRLTGDIVTGQYDIRRIGRCGCVAHATIVQHENLTMWLGNQTFYGSEFGRPSEDIGEGVYKYFSRNASKSTTEQLQLKRAVGIDAPTIEKLLFFIPAETTTAGNVAANTNSKILVFDTYRKEWREWGGWNMAGGIARIDDEIFWVERRYSTFSSGMAYNAYRRLADGDQYDMVDHNTKIDFIYQPGWWHAGRPQVLKDINNFILSCSNDQINPQFDVLVTVEADFQPGNVICSETLHIGTGSGGGFGDEPFGDFAFGDPVDSLVQSFGTTPQSAKSFRMTLSGSVFCQYGVIRDWDIEANASFLESTQK